VPNPRKELLITEEIYHIYNKSIGETNIFYTKRDLSRSLSLINFYRFPQKIKYSRFKTLPEELKNDYFSDSKRVAPQVEIYAFCLMPNHYHLLLKQLQDGGISTFISNFQNGFAKYFNKKYDRLGGLFIRPFKSKRVTSDEIFLHISRYIHLNPLASFLSKYEDIKFDSRSSYPIYLGKTGENFVNTDPVLKIISSIDNYEKFVRNQVDYQRKLHLIKNHILE